MKISKPDAVIKKTRSLCPICFRKLDAAIVRRGSEYFLKKKCPEHGGFRAVIWRGDNPSFEQWSAGYVPPIQGSNCPDDCGLCKNHQQKTCCALVEVTSLCNLTCPICFAGNCSDLRRSCTGAASSSFTSHGTRLVSKPLAADPTVNELYEIFRSLAGQGNTFVQLSGGEPTMRDDLPEIVAAAKRAGCETIQLNTNGIRLGQEPEFTKRLKDAGLSFVFLQFDGTRDDIYARLRGRNLLAEKLKAIRVCGENFIGVSLVPTVAFGVNSDNIGDIISFGIKNSPTVRGIHFQPVSYFGRYPQTPSDEDRITLPEILHAIEAQTDNLSIIDFVPSSCDHPRCGFHGDFVVMPDFELMKLTKKDSSCCREDNNAHLKNRNFVARRWKRESVSNTESGSATFPSEKARGKVILKEKASGTNPTDLQNFDSFLSRVKSHGFTITAMAFQDAFNIDFERLARCSLHVASEDRLIPFCANYLTGTAL